MQGHTALDCWGGSEEDKVELAAAMEAMFGSIQ